MAEEATINPDGTQDMPPVEDPVPPPMESESEIPIMDEETMEEVVKGTDPAIYLIIVAVLVFGVMIYFAMNKKKDDDGFFDELDGDKVCNKCNHYRTDEAHGRRANQLSR
jgi:hypothetical protein